MAVSALRTTLAAVDVVRCVTGYALLRGRLVAIAKVARVAGDLLVLVTQWKSGLVVIEVDSTPRKAVVAARAFAPQLAFVRLLLSMTGVAVRRCFAEALALHVATVAEHCRMCSVQ